MAAIVAGLVCAVVVPGVARAGGPGAWDNPCSGDVNVAACERLTYIAEHQADSGGVAHEDAWVIVAFLGVGVIAPGFWRVIFP